MTSCTKTMRVLMACIALWCAASAGVAVAQDVDTPEAEPPSALARSSDGPAFEISHFELRYRFEHPNHPDLDALRDLPIALGLVRDGYVAPREGLRVEWTTLGQLMTPSATERYYASALQRILESVLAWYTSREFIGVFVGPDPNDITSASVDVRPEGRTAVAIVIATARVTELRTLASGDRVSDHGPILPEDRINNPKHARHIESSPIRPWGGESWIPRTDLLRGDAINDHMFFLSRHPGRRVDASISAADEPGTAALDYLITENNPLTIFAQVSNTGTPSTSNWRERIGLYHTQLTENDDILSLDYVTGDFDRAHSFRGSYEAPFGTPRLRWRITGNWSQYNSEEVGFFDANFSGNTWGFSAEFIANLYQDRQLFVDIITGVRVAEHEVDNSLVGQGKETFSLPFFGVQVEKQTDWYDTRGSAILEFQAGAPDDMQLERLGRTDPDDKWIVLRWFTSHSVYLEPLLDRAAWEDPTTPGSSTLAHEIRAVFRGQYAFDNRLIPQEQSVVGGLYSVRGYPQSAVAGDTTLIGTLEYRYHLPRAFGIESEPVELFGQPFRRAPQFVYGTPDWDLILKSFVDVGQTYQSNKLSFENDETLIGVGVGLEFQYRRNLNVRLDWGFALEELESVNVDQGDNRLHLVATILF